MALRLEHAALAARLDSLETQRGDLLAAVSRTRELIVELDVPGFEEKELALEVLDHTLTIKGEKATEKLEENKSYYLQERLEKHFERRFTLPPDVDTEHIDARFHTGVLEVHVPKVEPLKARTIEIAK